MWRRAQAAAGVVGIAAVVVGLALPGTPPKTSDSVAKVTRTLLDHRSEFLASTYVFGLGCLLLLLFMGALRSHLGRESSLAGSAFGAGVAGVALLMTGSATFDGLSLKASGMHDPAVIRAFVDVGNAQFAMAGLAFSALLVAGSAAGPLPRWLRALGYVGAATLVVGGLSLVVDHGPLQAGGVLGLILTAPTIVWIAAASVVTLRATSSG
jgi:TM2 domain-containing membrane protein YozV